jgi:hypothetical protein
MHSSYLIVVLKLEKLIAVTKNNMNEHMYMWLISEYFSNPEARPYFTWLSPWQGNQIGRMYFLFIVVSLFLKATEIAQTLDYIFPRQKLLIYGMGYYLGDFNNNWSGHLSFEPGS